jgi:hypothetical protein
MPVYSKIQQIRDAKRRERQPKWKQRKQKESRELSQSLSAVQKRKQRENTTKFIKADAERKANARESSSYGSGTIFFTSIKDIEC